MPRKSWIQHLPGEFYILVMRRTEQGEMVEFAVVLIYDEVCIARYDTAHGFAHRDVLGKKSALIRKQRYDNVALKEVFEYALRDFTENYRDHLAFFLQN